MKEETIVLKDEETGKEYTMAKVNPLWNYSFCPQCVHIRGEDASPTLLAHWEGMYFNSWGMCKKCFDHINDHKSQFEGLAGNIKVDENGQVMLVRDNEDV